MFSNIVDFHEISFNQLGWVTEISTPIGSGLDQHILLQNHLEYGKRMNKPQFQTAAIWVLRRNNSTYHNTRHNTFIVLDNYVIIFHYTKHQRYYSHKLIASYQKVIPVVYINKKPKIAFFVSGFLNEIVGFHQLSITSLCN